MGANDLSITGLAVNTDRDISAVRRSAVPTKLPQMFRARNLFFILNAGLSRTPRTRPSASSTIGCNSQLAHPAYASPPRILSAPAWPNGVPAKSPSAGDMAIAIGLGGRSVRRLP
jgi:hypothetical protein